MQERLSCRFCGAFLRREPDRRERAEFMKTCDGRWRDPLTDPPAPVLTGPPCGRIVDHEPHDYAYSECTVLHRRCRRCGRENMEAEL